MDYWGGTRDVHKQHWSKNLLPTCPQSMTTLAFSCFLVCASADPTNVLGGFPPGTTVSEYGDSSTAFVVTYLVSSSPEIREAAMAWEEAFIALAKEELHQLAKDAKLSFNFYTERWEPGSRHRVVFRVSNVWSLGYWRKSVDSWFWWFDLLLFMMWLLLLL